MEEEKSVRSAVIVMPPEHFWPQIQAIRREHDKAYDRWMPHINCLYPFVPEPKLGFLEEAKKLEISLKERNFKPFKILFSKDSFGYFKHGKRATVWIKPLFLKMREITKVTKKQLQPFVKKSVAHVQKPADHHKSAGQRITVTEPVIESPYTRGKHCNEHIGLSALANAVWKDEDLIQERTIPSNIHPGLDCLRFAEWGTETETILDKVFTQQDTKTKVKKYTPKVTAHAAPICYTQYNKPDDKISDVNENPEISQTSQTHLQALEYEKKKEGYGTFPIGHHRDVNPDIITLQRHLLEAFPFCDELNLRSEEGFSPHLTLGQCDSKNVDEFIDKLKCKWKDFYFTVDKVCIISRKGVDPFEVRETVNLC